MKPHLHANISVIDSALLLIQGLAARIQQLIDAGADPAAFQALADEIKALADKLLNNPAVIEAYLGKPREVHA